MTRAAWTLSLLMVGAVAVPAAADTPALHVWETHEITLEAEGEYANPYVEVICWVQLRGPGFDRRVYGFWDGGRTFRVRVVATTPGEWFWRSGSNRPAAGLNGKSGSFEAVAWTEEEKRANPNRHGFLRATANGHAFQHADGTPFFFVADTWWAAGSWRYPLEGHDPPDDYVPGPGIGLEEAVQYRKNQGYNGIAMIASFPSWLDDDAGHIVRDSNDIPHRQGWERGGDAEKIKAMHDDDGNNPFFHPGRSPSHPNVMPDFDRINPAYFQSLDGKLQYLSDEGFVPFLETVRRDHGTSWKHYYDWPESFSRYVQYIYARYGSLNVIFSGVHFDWEFEDYSLDGPTWNDALAYHWAMHGSPPFGQPVTSLATPGTLSAYGHGKDAPWLTMHGAGNAYRDHRVYALLEDHFRLPDPFPTLNQEAWYPGWYVNTILGERPPFGSDLDDYYARAMAYGSVLSGGLAGHVYGTGAYDGSTLPEPPGRRPYIWEAMQYASGAQMGHLSRFVLSEGTRYQELELAGDDLDPRHSPDSHEEGLTGWAFLMRTPHRGFALAYFERGCERATVSGLRPEADYRARWFDPREGRWVDAGPGVLSADADGRLTLPPFPGGQPSAEDDWAFSLVLQGTDDPSTSPTR